MKNAFGMLKKTFKILLFKSNLHILFIPDVVTYCCLLYNLILKGRDVDVDALILKLENEYQQGGIRRHLNSRTNARPDEVEVASKVNELSKSSRRLTLEAYIEYKQAHRE